MEKNTDRIGLTLIASVIPLGFSSIGWSGGEALPITAALVGSCPR